ncbi:MAG: hypothetical protein ACYTDY_11360 [Planctomycetota bacterium]|jgi:hypothetical protein
MVRGSILAALVAALGMPLAWQATPAADQGTMTRYKVALVRVIVPASTDGAPLHLKDAAGLSHPAIKFRSATATAAGYFGALQYPHDLMKHLHAMGEAEVLFRAEMETVRGREGIAEVKKEIPVRAVDVRGDQTIITTKYQRVGLNAQIMSTDDRHHDIEASFTAVSAWTPGGEPILFSVATRGSILLPDGYTAVLAFLDRVEGESLTRLPWERVSDQPKERERAATDSVARCFLLVTRLDLDSR